MKEYLLLRLRTQLRQWAELGWWRALLLLAMGAAAVHQVWMQLRHPAVQWVVLALLLLSMGGAQRWRKDLAFLQLTAPQYRRWLMAEYALLGVPVAALLLTAGHYWLGASGAVLLPPLAAWVPPAATRVAGRRRSLVRAEVFEWVSGLRRRGGWPVWLGLLGVAMWQRQATAAPALCLGAWLLLVSSFYDTPESTIMLLSGATSASSWLRWRLGWAVAYFSTDGSPFLALLVLGAAGWGGAALLAGWATMVLVMVVLAKYTFYPHQAIMRYAQAGVMALGFLILLDSVYVALLAAVLVGLIWRSRHRLNSYRYD